MKSLIIASSLLFSGLALGFAPTEAPISAEGPQFETANTPELSRQQANAIKSFWTNLFGGTSSNQIVETEVLDVVPDVESEKEAKASDVEKR
ncbi:MAG: hypothetical protein HRU19_09950 [Pseudobacteriovorax sp.]|nr:hypothetical protein [Pseudobacteriovorax sp.]